MSALIVILVVVLVVAVYLEMKQEKQLYYINCYEFPDRITKAIKEKYPHLTRDEIKMVVNGLRKYFIFCSKAKGRMVAMPSQVIDVAWHEFILFTREYELFCNSAIGRFLHHTPTESMKSQTLATVGIKRAWRLACSNENINPSSPQQLPLLFAIDAMLKIENGFTYTLNCEDKAKASPGSSGGFCASHIECTSGCSGDSGSSGDCSDGGGCSGGGCGGE